MLFNQCPERPSVPYLSIYITCKKCNATPSAYWHVTADFMIGVRLFVLDFSNFLCQSVTLN